MEHRRLTMHGQHVAFRIAGEGPPLLLMHGMAASAETWRLAAPALARRFTVIAPDLLGHGDSAKPRSDYAVAAHANFMRDLLVVLDRGPATVVGHSFGGGVAMQLAYQYPDLCSRLVLVGSGGLGEEVSPLLRALSAPGVEQLFPLVCGPGLRDLGTAVGAMVRRFGLRPAPVVEETWRSYASLADPETRRAFFRTLRAVIDVDGQSVSAADRLYLAAHLPTLIVWGADDPIIPARHAWETHRMIPGSRIEVHPGVGHYPHVEVPERFVATLLDFVDTTEPAALADGEWHALLRGA